MYQYGYFNIIELQVFNFIFFFFQASPAPIIVNTDTLDTIPYVSIKGFFNKYVVLVYFHTEILFGIA